MMESNREVLEIPYGMRDFLPEEAAQKRNIEAGLAGLFAVWGYDEVVTPTMEYLDTLTMGNGGALEPHMFKFFDRKNRTLALRHEMTTPIARLVASRLADAKLPLKLSYVSSVFRYEEAQTGRQCEFNQAGVELVGSSGASADAEIIALAVEGMKRIGLTDFQICLGQVEFVGGIMAQAQLSDSQQEKMKGMLERHDLVGWKALVEQAELPQRSAEILQRIPLLHGKKELLASAYDFALNEQSRRALDNLAEIHRLLEAYGVAEYVSFDLSVIRDFGYYTGMVFEAYAPGLGFPLCGGGRYDRLFSDFGTASPATGFSLGIERAMLALQRQGIAKPALQKDVYVSYAEGKRSEAISTARKLRDEGKVAELALASQGETEAAEAQAAKGYRELRYIK